MTVRFVNLKNPTVVGRIERGQHLRFALKTGMELRIVRERIG